MTKIEKEEKKMEMFHLMEQNNWEHDLSKKSTYEQVKDEYERMTDEQSDDLNEEDWEERDEEWK